MNENVQKYERQLAAHAAAGQRYKRSTKGRAAHKRYIESGRRNIDARNYAWKRHGIDMDYSRYLKLVEACGECCVLCTEDENVKRRKRQGLIRTLAVDHDHATGKVRGLLCNRHNLALGNVEKCIPALLQYLGIT
jgi:hypothetical protein